MKKYRISIFQISMSIYSLFYIFPFFWMFFSSFKSNGEIFGSPLALPKSYDFAIFAEAWRAGGISRYVFNSAIVTASTVIIILIFASMAAFAFSRFEFKGKNLLLLLITLGLLLPVQAYFISQNIIFEQMGIKDTRLALIIPYIAMGLPLAIWLLKAYLDTLPKEVFEAARVDGAGDFVIYLRIVLPLLKPGIGTVAVFSTLSAWNEFLLAIIYIQNDNLKTIPTGLLAFSTRYVTDYQLLFAALTIITIPMVTIYVIFNRQVVAGLTDGSLK
jgi:raffinose/stachyose/melibiose transport system permease protein